MGERDNSFFASAFYRFNCIYSVHKLVHFECFSSIKDAIAREKQLKTWHRPWKENLIRKNNPTWDDLSPSILA